jgi:hypothetical protein
MTKPPKEIADLKAENKKLKALLKNAVQLLHQSKEIIQHSGQPALKKARKKTAKKRTKGGSHART